KRELKSSYEPKECIVNVGGKHSIFNVASVLVQAGDEVLIPAPYWVSFPDIIKYTGATPVYVHTNVEDGFAVRAEAIEKAITPKTRLLILNSPSNPTGGVTPPGEYERILAVWRAQHAALAAMTGTMETVPVMLAEYARRRKRIVDGLNAIPGVKCQQPGGAFYAFPDVSAHLSGPHAMAKDTTELATLLLERARVALVGGDAFGAPGYLRISYATSLERIEEGLRRLDKFFSRAEAAA